jgi:hypothetical protein
VAQRAKAVLWGFSRFQSAVMVNDTFKAPRRYGFKRVHARLRFGNAAMFINEKFTPNRFTRLFVEFSSI